MTLSGEREMTYMILSIQANPNVHVSVKSRNHLRSIFQFDTVAGKDTTSEKEALFSSYNSGRLTSPSSACTLHIELVPALPPPHRDFTKNPRPHR